MDAAVFDLNIEELTQCLNVCRTDLRKVERRLARPARSNSPNIRRWIAKWEEICKWEKAYTARLAAINKFYGLSEA